MNSRSILMLVVAALALQGAGRATVHGQVPPPSSLPRPGQLTVPPPPTVTAPATKTPAKPAKDETSIEPGAIGNIKPFETGIDYRPTPPGKLITFNLEDAELPDLVRLISQITGRRFIISAKSRAIKATVYAPTKVTAAEAYQAFLSILELNGMSVVPAGRYYKIIESGGIETRPIPLQTDNEAVPRGDRYLTRLQRLNNISSDEAVELLTRFKSGDGNLTSYASTNMLIVTDTGENITRMIRVLNMIDVPRTRERIWIESVRHATATDVAKSLTDIFEPSADKGGQKAAPAKGGKGAAGAVGSRTGEVHLTKVLADQRTNSLIILGTDAAYLRVLDILRRLDSQPEGGEGRIHVHYLQHSDAEEIANTLSKLTGKLSGKSAKEGGPGETFEGQIDITAQKTANALVITASARDYASLRRTIDDLDRERRQVFIEAAIMDMSVNRKSNLGVSYHGGIPNFPADGSLGVVGFNATKTVGGLLSASNTDLLSGLAIGVQGKNLDTNILGMTVPSFGIALSATATSGDADVLSTPHLIAMDHVEAEITVGGNVPLQTSAPMGLGSLGGLGGLGGLTGTTGTAATSGLGALGALGALGGLGGYGYGSVPRQDVGTTVKITPHINESNQIRLEIAEEISEAGDPSGAGNLGVISISRTRAKTQVSVADQQTVVIGGLMRDTVRTGQTKVPILGDIPLIGMLFRQSKKEKEKKNLVLFLTPYIIRSQTDLRAIYERKMRERQEFLDRYFVFSGTEYEPPVDYSRTRGLVSEMLAEIRALDERRKLAEAAKLKPPDDYAPQPAVGESVPSGSGADADNSAAADKPVGQTAEPSNAAPAADQPPPTLPGGILVPPPNPPVTEPVAPPPSPTPAPIPAPVPPPTEELSP